MSTDDTQKTFERARRNLVIMAFIIIAYKLGNMNLSGANISGLNLTIQNEAAVAQIFWILIVYFTWRYYSAFHDTKKWSVFSRSFNDELDGKTFEIAERKIKTTYGANRYFDGSPIAERTFFKSTHSFRIHDGHDGGGGQNIADKSVSFKGWLFFKFRCLAVFNTLIRRSVFSELILPFIIALIAMLELSGFPVVEKSLSTLNALFNCALGLASYFQQKIIFLFSKVG